ncbi:Fimbrial protein [compost metagenome]
MNKSFLGLAISTLFMVGAAQADVNPNDVSATLSVTGSVTHEVNCAVNVGRSVVDLQSDIAKLAKQGDTGNISSMQTVELSLSGDEECDSMAREGKITYSFHGTADSADGTSLANTDLSVGAAQGVGIALYNVNDHSILKINQDKMIAQQSFSVNQLGLDLVKLNNQEVKAGSVQGSVTIQIERL